MKINVLILLGVGILLSFFTGQIFTQQETGASEELEPLRQQWVLGDVIALDLESNQLILGYIDYNTDEEKEITIGVDADTKYENVDSFQDIKINDAVAIDYRISFQGEAIALTITKE